MNEAFKKQLLSSHEYFQAKRWEGKPWKFKLKYLVSNYPEFALSAVAFGLIFPAICWYRFYSYPGSRKEAVKKYKVGYIVVRDDHPNLDEIIKEKNLGREHFPQY